MDENNETQTKKTAHLLRLDDEIERMLADLLVYHRRSVNNFVEWLISEEWKRIQVKQTTEELSNG